MHESVGVMPRHDSGNMGTETARVAIAISGAPPTA